MKNKIVNIENNMSSLEKSMDKINNLSSIIEENLYVKRKEITKLDIVNKDL